MDPARKALNLLKYLPRFSDKNVLRDPYKPKKQYIMRGSRRPRWPAKSNEERQRWHPIGYEPGRLPWYLKVPAEKYYKQFDARRQYPPFSLQQLQMLIDTNLVDVNKPIDLAVLCNANHYFVSPTDNHYGVNLTMEGIDNFRACVNIEVQYAKEPIIAAIERNGGRITTAYYDIRSVTALADPHRFFRSGEPIPKRQLPPPNAIDYYTDAKNRGYLADSQAIEEDRFKLAQKYGYEIPIIEDPAKRAMLEAKKHVKQIFFGLEPGLLINLKDKEILEPLDPELRQYYGLPPVDETTTATDSVDHTDSSQCEKS